MKKKNLLIWGLIYGGIVVLIIAFFLLWCFISGTNPIEWLSSKYAMYLYLGVGLITIIYIGLTLQEIAKGK